MHGAQVNGCGANRAQIKALKNMGNGGPGGTRTPNQAVMSRRL